MPKPRKKSSSALTPIPWPKLLHEAQTRFGIQRFRPGQKEVISSVFSGGSTLALMPTGAGKSLTYQLPALFLPRPTVVVSPLIALMQDQQEKAEQADVTVEKLDSTIRAAAREKAHEDIAEGSAQLIYVTPEKLGDQSFLAELNAAGGISLLVIDEAHTIAQWGHDFRPAFNSIGEARKTLGNPPILALTATATEEVVDEILHSLHAEDATRISTGIERPNLAFAVHPTVNNEAKVARILAMIGEEEGTGIIYTASVRAANDLFENLTAHGISVGHYHGKMPTRERERVQEEFMRGDHRVMIATKAFGLGIDKPDIRFVIHFEFPDSLETYYQEAGRAGRDGLPARATLLYRLEDKRIQTYFQAGRYPKPAELEAVYQAIAAPPSQSRVTSADTEPREGSSTDQLPSLASGPAQERGTRSDSEESHLTQTAGDPSAQDISLTPASIAEIAGTGIRRTEVILNLLTEAQLIQRTATGFARVTTQSTEQAALESLLNTYTDRATRDKDRLAEMMHYAESPTCRFQLIRTYFSEPEADPCGRCDNCLRPHPEASARSAVSARSTVSSTRSSSPGDAGGILPVLHAATPDAAHPHQEVTIVETPTGSIQTTAPETLPKPSAEPAFHPGDQVRHKRFGPGEVLDVHNDNVLVSFSKAGQKRLRASFLTAA